MSIKEINLGESVNLDKEVRCHLMPCRIEHNGNTLKAREYFWPTIRKLNDGDDDEDGRDNKNIEQNIVTGIMREDDNSDNSIYMASFRGRPLQGRKVQLPDGYTARTSVKTINNSLAQSQSCKQNFHFNKFTYWNWDEIPNKDDKVSKAFDWISVAKAIHDPIE